MNERRSDEEIITEANEAISLLGNSAFGSATKRAEQAIIERWKRAKTPALREQEHAQLQGLTLIVTELMTLANDGKQVQHLLDNAQKAERGPGTSQRKGA